MFPVSSVGLITIPISLTPQTDLEVDWDPKKLNDRRLEELQKDSRIPYSHRGAIPIDNTLIDREGKMIEDVGYFWGNYSGTLRHSPACGGGIQSGFRLEFTPDWIPAFPAFGRDPAIGGDAGMTDPGPECRSGRPIVEIGRPAEWVPEQLRNGKEPVKALVRNRANLEDLVDWIVEKFSVEQWSPAQIKLSIAH